MGRSPEGVAARVPLVDLAAQHEKVKAGIRRRLDEVFAHGRFIMGPEVDEFEARLASFCSARHVISCSSGTDALLLALLAYDVGPGDAVVVPAFTFVAAPEVIALLGATPVFVDVSPETFLIDLASLEWALEDPPHGLRVRGVVPVDLFGLACDYEAIGHLAERFGIFVLGDAAQSLGATSPTGDVGALADVTATSFFPTKPLGCYGDGGAVLTDDDALAGKMRSIRVHGGGDNKYDNVRLGLNARLDTIQAAILLEKMDVFEDELRMRDHVARRYSSSWTAHPELTSQHVPDGYVSAWAQYTVVTRDRDALAAALRKRGVSSAIYYPKPLHHQGAYTNFPVAPGGAPVAERLSGNVISLPMHPYLDARSQDLVVETILGFHGA